MSSVDLQGLTTSESEFMAKLREYESPDTWLLFVNHGFSMETARSLYDKGLIDTSKQMGMPAARLKRAMTAEEAAHECIEFSLTFGGLEKEEFRLNIVKLRELGYVLIPIQPSEETVAAARHALVEDLSGQGKVAMFYDKNDDGLFELDGNPLDFNAAIRAAYAAIVGVEG